MAAARLQLVGNSITRAPGGMRPTEMRFVFSRKSLELIVMRACETAVASGLPCEGGLQV